MFSKFAHQQMGKIVRVPDEKARYRKFRDLPKIVLMDLVTPEIRSRKPNPEFPLSIDVIGRRLADEGYNVDYSFLPTEYIRRFMRKRRELLCTFGMNGQQSEPIKNTGILGINMMNYLQAPQFFTLLALAGIPLRRGDRNKGYPLIILGGHIWQNPLPLSDYYDVLIAGDGEEVLCLIADLIMKKWKNRRDLLAAIAHITGAYVPEFPRVPVEPAQTDFSDGKYSAGSSVILNGTGAVILSRGCPHDCAFCVNKVSSGEYRIKPYSQVMRHIDILSNAGAQRIVLCTATGAHYQSEGKGYADVIHEIGIRGMTARCMSDRLEFLAGPALEMMRRDKNKAVLALESHPRIRSSVLQKTISDDMIERAADACIKAGIGQIQLYAIIAVPPISPGLVAHMPGGFEGESDGDYAYLSGLGMRLANRMRTAKTMRSPKEPYINFDCMPLIPAPGTRLQSLSFPKWETYQARLERLKASIPPKYRDDVRVTAGFDPLSHLLQALLDRGSNVAGRIVAAACRKADFGVLSIDDVRSAMTEYGIDEEILFNEIPVEKLPYAGLLARRTSWRVT